MSATGMNFFKQKDNQKLFFVTGTNISGGNQEVNDNEANRSSSAFEQKRSKLHSSPHLKQTKFEEKIMKPYDFIPKITLKQKPSNYFEKEKIQEDLMKLKQEFNKKNKEYNMLRAEFMRLEDENKRNNKVIEEFIIEATKFSPEINNYMNRNKDDNNDDNNKAIPQGNPNPMNFTSLNSSSIIKLREVFMINSLKKQISNFKQILKMKEEELINLKKESKISNYQKLEAELRNKVEELFNLRESFEKLTFSSNNKDLKIRELSDEVEYMKMLGEKAKNQAEEAKNKLKIFQDENIKLSETKKLLEEKINSNNMIISSQKNLLKEKDNQLKQNQEESKAFEAFQIEKPKMEKKLTDLTKQLSAFKEGLERKNQRIKDLETQNINLTEKHEIDLNQRSSALNKKIKSLEQEISSLKKRNDNSKTLYSGGMNAFLTTVPGQEQNKELNEKLKKTEKELEIQIELTKKLEKDILNLEEEKLTIQAEFERLDRENDKLIKEKERLDKLVFELTKQDSKDEMNYYNQQNEEFNSEKERSIDKNLVTEGEGFQMKNEEKINNNEENVQKINENLGNLGENIIKETGEIKSEIPEKKKKKKKKKEKELETNQIPLDQSEKATIDYDPPNKRINIDQMNNINADSEKKESDLNQNAVLPEKSKKNKKMEINEENQVLEGEKVEKKKKKRTKEKIVDPEVEKEKLRKIQEEQRMLNNPSDNEEMMSKIPDRFPDGKFGFKPKMDSKNDEYGEEFYDEFLTNKAPSKKKK